MPAEAYSSLEVVHYDQSANAPHRDHAKCPPELDTAVLAPQALAHAGPEVAYDTTPPEILDVVGNSAGASTEKVKSTTLSNHWSSRQIVLIVCVVSAAITVIIAVSIRFGPASKKSTMPTTVTQTIAMSTSSTMAAAQPTEMLSQPHGIINDSALAAVEMPNGDRRVFFQENEGYIRQAIYLGSSKRWSAGASNIVVKDAKKHTPLATVAINTTTFVNIRLFYIAANNSLSSVFWGIYDDWSDGGEALTSHTSATSSRHLSASFLDSPLRLFLFYENINGSLTVLRNSNFALISDTYRDPWVDITNDIRSYFSEISAEIVLNFRAPFSSSAYGDRLAISLASESHYEYFQSTYNSLGNYYLEIVSFPMLDNLRGLDIEILFLPEDYFTAIWTNSSAQKLHILGYFGLSPEPPFPFSRIAAINSNISKEFPVMIYHQLTESVLVEQIWENTNRIWLKNNITI